MMFQGGSRDSNQYVNAFNYAYENTVEGKDEELNYKTVTQSFYDIATDFYMWGWGRSFHFAPRNKGEGFHESLLRHEHWLCAQLKVKPGDQVCDLGCGVCGPMVNIAKFTRSNITGVTIDEYQVGKGNDWIKRNNLSTACKAVQGDFHDLPFEENAFDCGYDIEASAHSTKLPQFFKEVERVLKPGGVFAGFAWVSTPKYNDKDEVERKIMEGIAYGNGLSVIHSFEEYKTAIEANPNLELVEDYDCNKLGDDLPWYDPLLPKYSLEGCLATRPGRFFTANLTRCLETVGLAPKGAFQTTIVLEDAARCLVAAGEREIYTPIHYYLVRKKKKE